MKKIIALCLSFALIFSLAGCGQDQTTYSNLASKESLSQVEKTLEDNGISKENTTKVLKWVKEFNNISKSYELAKDFQKLPEKGIDYSPLIMDDSAKSYNHLQWLNCRLTAYSLLKDKINTTGKGNPNDPWIMFDVEAINTVPQFKMTKSEKANFVTLFNQVSVKGTKTVLEHEKKIKEAWKDRNIKINSDDVSLVCIYIHAPEDKARFVGHTGILAKTGKGLLFFEKYSNIAPFQATYFENKDQLKKYLLSRDDLYGDDTELAPIVTENGEILK